MFEMPRADLLACAILIWTCTVTYSRNSGSDVIKTFSCSTELSMKFYMIVNIKHQVIQLFLGSDKPKMLFFPAHKC